MNKIKNLHLIALFVICAAGAYLRLAGTSHGSFAFTYDVGRDLLAVQKMVETHRISLLGPTTGIEGVFYGPWWYLFLALPFLISGGNPYFIAGAIGLLGILMIPLSYILGKEIGGRSLGLFIALFVALSSPLVGFSTQIWNPDLLPPIILSSLVIYYFLIKEKLKNIVWWGISGLLVGLAFEMEASLGFFFLVSMTLLALIKSFSLKRWSQFVVFLFGPFLIEIPRVIFEIRHNFLQTNSLINHFKVNSQSDNLLLKLNDSLLFFWHNWSDTLGARNTLVSISSLVFTLMALWFWRKKLKGPNALFIKSLIVIFLVIFFGFIFYRQSIWQYYFVGLPMIYLLIFLFAVLLLLERFRKRSKLIYTILLFLIFINARPIGIYESLKDPLFKGDAAVFRNQLKVMDALYEDANSANFNYIAYTPPIHTYTWDYLFSWYGQKKYGYQPSRETAGNFYLIIEPEFEHPKRLEAWFEIREGDGKFVKKEIIAGGIILEKRTR